MSGLALRRTGPRAGRERTLAWVVRGASLLVVLAVWEWYGRKPESFTVAPFTDVAADIATGIVDGTLLRAALGTLLVTAVGYVIAVVIGLTVGAAIALSDWAENTVEPLVHALYATPMSLMIPVLGIYTGLGFRGRVTLTVFWCVFEIIVTTAGGIRAVPRGLVDAGRAFGASRTLLYRAVVLPAALPSIALGLRLAVGRALRGAVTAEILLSVVNLGAIMVRASSGFDVERLLSGIVLVVLLGFALMWVAEQIERRAVARHHGGV